MNMFKVLLLIIVFSSIGCNSLSRAIRKDDTEKIISLLEKGKVDLNKLDYFGDTPLISAVRMGNIEAGADVNIMSEYIHYPNYSALVIASARGNSFFKSVQYTKR